MLTKQPAKRIRNKLRARRQRLSSRAGRGGLLVRLVVAAAASFLLVQGLTLAAIAATVAALVAVDTQRKRRHAPFAPFPHSELQPVTHGDNQLEIFTYGEDLYQAMLRAIDRAKECIFLETYIWKNDEVGQQFKDHLARKAEEGVQVYCIYDAVGNLVVPGSFKRFPPSIHMLAYFPFKRPRQLLDPRRYALDHRKLLIVDDYEAFIGGYNLGQVYATQWRDTHLRVTGPAAARLGRSFAEFWNQNTKEQDHITRTYHRGFDTSLVVRG
ncbi:MAG: phospholipase D-like domain-containing protein, partial [Ktedonobacterales bacterium]